MAETVKAERVYLEMTDPKQLKGHRIEDPLLRLARVPVPSVPLVQRLYREVGEKYHWVDRWKWAPQEWRDWVEQAGYGIWILSWDGDLAGFFELKSDAEGSDSVEVTLFGLTAPFIGRGLGKHLLTMAVDIAFAVGYQRVWLHTCSLDDPHALPNYKARGFTEFKRETYEQEL